MKAHKVSICIPTYQQPECLQKALESVREQSFDDYEVIITDDSKDDSIRNLLAKFHFGDKLKYFKNESRLGSPENWNEAIRYSTGEYIKILHHDDWFTSPQSLGEYVRMLDKHPESDFAFSATSIFHNNDGSHTSNSPDEKKLNEIRKNSVVLFFGNFVGAPSATIYRRSFNETFDRRIKYVVDIDFYIRILKQNPVFQYSNKTLICTKSGTEHQVTTECLNKNTQLYEYSYLYNKIQKGAAPSEKYILFFSDMINEYDVISIKEFQDAGEVPEPSIFISQIIQKRNWRLLKCKVKSIIKKLIGR